MKIPEKQMQKIAEEVGATILKDVNIMDKQGYIIASTAKERIGSIHVGAVKLLENHLPELIIEKEYQGVRNGINLPLLIDKKVIGVVGITGAVEEVRILGVVIKKMTEIMILDWYKNSRKQIFEEQKRSFVFELLFGEDEKMTEFGSDMFSIDILIPRIMSVWDIEILEKIKEERRQELMENIISKIKKGIELNSQQLVVRIGMRVVSIHGSDNSRRILQRIREIKKDLEQLYPCRIYCGTGNSGIGKTGLQKSYKEAELACNLARTKKECQVREYNETDISMLLINIPLKKRVNFVNEVFKNCDLCHRKEIFQCLKSYIKNNGSISKISEELYIHKNTLQYRLTKMKSVTGFDPRVLEEAIPLALALYMDEFRE